MRVISLHEFAWAIKEEFNNRWRFDVYPHPYLCPIAADLFGGGAPFVVHALITEAYPNISEESYLRNCYYMPLESFCYIDSRDCNQDHNTLRCGFLDRLLAQPDRMIVIPD